MKTILKLTLLILVMNLFTHNVWALTIISPKEGQVVYQGDKLTVIVKPDSGEKWEEVLLDIYPMSYNILTNEYKEEIEIPEDETGMIDFDVLAYDKSGNKVKLTRNLFVKLPPNVVLQGIGVDPDFMVVYKLPPESDPKDIQKYEFRQIGVGGIYSDGVQRYITSSTDGTTYTSSNEQVVTVDKEGKVSAKGIGKAIITVRNGKYSATVDVVVKPYQ